MHLKAFVRMFVVFFRKRTKGAKCLQTLHNVYESFAFFYPSSVFVIWCACLFYPVHSIAYSLLLFFSSIPDLYAITKNYNVFEAGSIRSLSISVQRTLECILWLTLSIEVFVWDVELNCRFRSVDVNVALS